jgi:hypothetical protein
VHKTTQPQLLLMWTPLTFTQRVTADANLIDVADTEIERLLLFCLIRPLVNRNEPSVTFEWPQRQQQKWPIMSRFIEKYFNYIAKMHRPMFDG